MMHEATLNGNLKPDDKSGLVRDDRAKTIWKFKAIYAIVHLIFYNNSRSWTIWILQSQYQMQRWNTCSHRYNGVIEKGKN